MHPVPAEINALSPWIYLASLCLWLALSGKSRSPIETALFPAFVSERPLATMGEPFALVVRRQAG